MGMEEFSFSMRMRDTIRRMMKEAIDSERPRYRYASVVSFERVTRKCTVIFNGETNPVIVNMGSIQPKQAGQIVRIEGIGTDKFITDVVGEPWYPDTIATTSYVDTTTTNLVNARTNAPTGWVIPTLLNGWVEYDAPGSGYRGPRYKLLSNGQVEIQGLVKNGTAAQIFQLPAAYRPGAGEDLVFATMTNPDTVGRLDITTAGYVQMNIGSNLWFSINCTFTPG